MKITDPKAYFQQIQDVNAKGTYHDDWASLTDFTDARAVPARKASRSHHALEVL